MPKMRNKESYNEFRNRIYSYLLDYKEKNITKQKGSFKSIESDYFLPDSVSLNEFPAMMYEHIIRDIQESEFKFKPHIFSYRHIASSQTACINLFIPILESQCADDILSCSMAIV